MGRLRSKSPTRRDEADETWESLGLIGEFSKSRSCWAGTEGPEEITGTKQMTRGIDGRMFV